jgi:hypothetical protein
MSLHIIDSLLLFFCLIVTLEKLSKTPFIKGIFGEYKVKRLLNRYINKDQYHIINNIILPTDNGTTQIDHIVISKFGIFVIETKNINRWIAGDEKSPFWTQMTFRKKRQFQNPLRQNYQHIKTLENILEISEKSMYSIVALTGSYKFKGEMPAKVVDVKNLIEYIQSRDTVLLKEEEREIITRKLSYYKSQTTFKKSLQHIVNVKNKDKVNLYQNLSLPTLVYEVVVKNITFLKIVILLLSALIIAIVLNKTEKNNFQDTAPTQITSMHTMNKNLSPSKKINTKEIHPDQSTKFSGAIYSWKNEQGIKVYSNKGFPQNGKYTEGKVEWQ